MGTVLHGLTVSCLRRIDQQWQYRIYCKSMKAKELQQLHHYLERSLLTEPPPYGEHLDRNTGRTGTQVELIQNQNSGTEFNLKRFYL